MATLASLLISLGVDAGDMEQGLDRADRSVAGFARRVGSNLQSVGSAALLGVGAAAVGVGAGVVAVARQAIPAASNLNEALNATSVVFGDAAGVVQAYGQEAATSAGLSEQAFNQMAATTGAMLQNYGLSADEAATSTVDLAQRAADMASIFNTDVDDAMEAINAGLRGEGNSLERFGVSMNATTVEAQALAMGFEKVDGQFEAAALTQARMALLMEQTDAIAGDFTNTSDELANSTRINEARWDNFMAKVGKLGLPIMQAMQGILMSVGEKVFPIVEGAINRVMPVVEGISDALGTFVDALLSGTPPMEALSGLLNSVFGEETAGRVMTIISSIQAFGAKLAEMMAPVMTFIQNNVQLQDVLAALGIAIAAVVIPALVSIVTAAAPIIATFVAVVAVIAALRAAWESDFLGIRTAVTQFWEGTLQPALTQVVAWLKVKVPQAVAAVSGWFTGTFLPAAQAVGAFIQDSLMPFFSALAEVVGTAVKLAFDVLAGFFQNIFLPALRSVGSYLSTRLQPIFETIGNFIETHVAPKFEMLNETVGGLSGILETVVGWLQTLKTKLDNIQLPDWAQRHSPSPFEMTFIGANEAIRELARARLPELNTRLNMTGGVMPAAGAMPAMQDLGGGGGSRGGGVINITLPPATVYLDGRRVGQLAWPGVRDGMMADGWEVKIGS